MSHMGTQILNNKFLKILDATKLRPLNQSPTSRGWDAMYMEVTSNLMKEINLARNQRSYSNLEVSTFPVYPTLLHDCFHYLESHCGHSRLVRPLLSDISGPDSKPLGMILYQIMALLSCQTMLLYP